MKVLQHLVQLENGEQHPVVLFKADGFQLGDICSFRVDGMSVHLSSRCSPIELTTMKPYWLALRTPEFADEGHACAQVLISHPDYLRAEVAYISAGPDIPTEMVPVEHRC